MERARRHQRLLAWLTFGVLALAAELAGGALIHRLDVGRHVATPSYANADYYPILLVVVKAGVALVLARVAWRFARARSVAAAARKLLAAHGGAPALRAPRVRLELSPRLWLGSFLLTSLIYLVQTDAEWIATGRWPLLAPWLHTSALPVFAVLAVAVAVLYGAVARWLAEYESYARETAAEALTFVAALLCVPRPVTTSEKPPRRLFGLAFESRPPPVPA
jgi:hypothetical protein